MGLHLFENLNNIASIREAKANTTFGTIPMICNPVFPLYDAYTRTDV